jgi:hypothetical protein
MFRILPLTFVQISFLNNDVQLISFHDTITATMPPLFDKAARGFMKMDSAFREPVLTVRNTSSILV